MGKESRERRNGSSDGTDVTSGAINSRNMNPARLLRNVQQGSSDTYEIDFRGVVTELELFLKRVFVLCGQLWPFAVSVSGQCCEGMKAVEKINRNTKEPCVTYQKETKVCREWKLLLERKKACSVPAKSWIRRERTGQDRTLPLIYCICFAS